MSALCALTASWSSSGTASAVFWSLTPPFGACTASALVTLLPLRVRRTWTGPYCVWATVPVTVRAWADDPADPEPPVDEDEDEPLPPDAAFALSIADCRDFLYPSLVYVAPEAASIRALCAATASSLSL